MSVRMTETWVEREATKLVGRTVADSVQRGLYLRIGAKKRTWRLVVRVTGKDYDLSLGSHPALVVEQARKRAAQKLAEIERGVVPTTITLKDAWALMQKSERHAPATLINYEGAWRRELHKLAGRKVTDICHPAYRHKLVELHADIRARRSDRTANFVITVLAAIIAHARRTHYELPRLDLTGFAFCPEPPSRPDLSQEAVIRHLVAVSAERHPVRQAFHRAVFYTGARPLTLLSARWDQLSGDTLHQLHTKTGPHDFPVTRQLHQLLDAMRGLDPVHIFPILGYWLKAEGGAMCPRAVRKLYATVAHDTVPFATAERLLCHALPGMAAVYVQPSSDALLAAAQAVADRLDATYRLA